MLVMRDEEDRDEKILAVPVDKLHPFYKDVASYKQLMNYICLYLGPPPPSGTVHLILSNGHFLWQVLQ